MDPAFAQRMGVAPGLAARAGAAPPHFVAIGELNPAYVGKRAFPDEGQLRLRWAEAWPAYAPREWTHPVVLANTRTAEKPDGWADPLWGEEQGAEAVAALAAAKAKLGASAPPVVTSLPDSTPAGTMTPEERFAAVSRVCLTLQRRGVAVMHVASAVPGPIYRTVGLGAYQSAGCFCARPRNPVGRTGLTGRGLLGKWGPNAAADPIVTRFAGEKLQMVAILRADVQQWAIPGGMVDYGERAHAAAGREFSEEALNVGAHNEGLEEAQEAYVLGAEAELAALFGQAPMRKDDPKDPKAAKAARAVRYPGLLAAYAKEHGTTAAAVEAAARAATAPVYAGYVDDPRNTDEAWMETEAFHFHVDAARFPRLVRMRLQAGDDATKARWIDVPGTEFGNIYASHRAIVVAALRAKVAEPAARDVARRWAAALRAVGEA